jgi:hypothetical protein
MQAQHTHTRTMNGAALATTLLIYLFFLLSFFLDEEAEG